MPSWAYLVVLMFAGLMAWPAIEPRLSRAVRRIRRRLTRGRTRRYSYTTSLMVRPGETPPDDPKVTRIKDSRRAA